MNIKITTRSTDTLCSTIDKMNDTLRRRPTWMGDARKEDYKERLAETVAALRAERAPFWEATEAALEKVNGRATTHTITQFTEVLNVAQWAEEKLDAQGVTKKSRVGATVRYRPSGPGKAYSRKGKGVMTTAVTLKRVGDGWRLIAAEKVEIWADSKGQAVIEISPEAHAEILAHAMDGFTVAGGK